MSQEQAKWVPSHVLRPAHQRILHESSATPHTLFIDWHQKEGMTGKGKLPKDRAVPRLRSAHLGASIGCCARICIGEAHLFFLLLCVLLARPWLADRWPCAPLQAAILIDTLCCDRLFDALLQEQDAPRDPRVPAMLDLPDKCSTSQPPLHAFEMIRPPAKSVLNRMSRPLL